MPFISRRRADRSTRLNRRAAPSCRGGASSMLRLAQPGACGLPPASALALALNQWVRGAGQALNRVEPAWVASVVSAQ